MAGYASDDEAIPQGDPSSSTGLLLERTQAWKHMCGFLEDYVGEVAKEQKHAAGQQEKIIKTINRPLKEGHHFDQATGGVAGLFENLRANTQGQAQLYNETSTALTGNVLPILQRLHTDVKNKHKELQQGAGKYSKMVDSARNNSQKHIELLGQHTATFDSAGGKVQAANDPYVLHRGVMHRLNKQVSAENTHQQDMLKVQEQFKLFEGRVVGTFQNALRTYQQLMANQADKQKAMYADVAGTAAAMPADFEWNGFAQRNSHVLLDPNAPLRKIDDVHFPNQDHRATKPMIAGTLERKHRGLGALAGYSSGYYAVTPAGFLHEYKDSDNFSKDPSPEMSLFLPNCVIGAVDNLKFIIKGKDVKGGSIGQKMSMTSEYTFRAHTNADAKEWHDAITHHMGHPGSVPTTPIDQKLVNPLGLDTAAAQQQGISSGPTSATSAHMQSPVSAYSGSPTMSHSVQPGVNTSVPGPAPGVSAAQYNVPSSHMATTNQSPTQYVQR